MYIHVNILIFFVNSVNKTGLIWQKEASDISSKSELLMFSYFYLDSVLCFQAKFYASTLILL